MLCSEIKSSCDDSMCVFVLYSVQARDYQGCFLPYLPSPILSHQILHAATFIHHIISCRLSLLCEREGESMIRLPPSQMQPKIVQLLAITPQSTQNKGVFVSFQIPVYSFPGLSNPDKRNAPQSKHKQREISHRINSNDNTALIPTSSQTVSAFWAST